MQAGKHSGIGKVRPDVLISEIEECCLLLLRIVGLVPVHKCLSETLHQNDDAALCRCFTLSVARGNSDDNWYLSHNSDTHLACRKVPQDSQLFLSCGKGCIPQLFQQRHGSLRGRHLHGRCCQSPSNVLSARSFATHELQYIGMGHSLVWALLCQDLRCNPSHDMDAHLVRHQILGCIAVASQAGLLLPERHDLLHNWAIVGAA